MKILVDSRGGNWRILTLFRRRRKPEHEIFTRFSTVPFAPRKRGPRGALPSLFSTARGQSFFLRMKRFTDTEKWSDPWFRKLKPAHKLFWLFLTDKCDNCGLWKVDLEIAEIFIGMKIVQSDLSSIFDSRIRDVGNGTWWIPAVIRFQCGVLSDACIPHRKIVSTLKEKGLYEPFIDYVNSKATLGVGVIPPTGRGEEEDKDKEWKNKGIEKGKPNQEFLDLVKSPLNTPDFMAKWETWVQVRIDGKKVKDFKTLFAEQILMLSRHSTQTAIAMLSQSIANGWQGLFELKPAQKTLIPNVHPSGKTFHERSVDRQIEKLLA